VTRGQLPQRAGSLSIYSETIQDCKSHVITKLDNYQHITRTSWTRPWQTLCTVCPRLSQCLPPFTDCVYRLSFLSTDWYQSHALKLRCSQRRLFCMHFHLQISPPRLTLANRQTVRGEAPTR